MMGFRKVPLWLLYSPVVSGLTSFQRDFLMFSQLARDARNCLPYDPALLRSVVFPGRPFVGLKEIAAARDHLVAAGVFQHKATQRKEWLEIAPEYRNNDGENETSFGEEEKAPEQEELKLSPQLIHIPQRAESREDQSKATESARGRENAAPMPAKPPKPDSGTQELSAGKDSARFARDADAIPNDALWQSLCRILGKSEMHQSGALWLKRYKLCRDALAVAVKDWQAMTPAGRKQWPNPAAYITTAFENEKAKFA